MQRTVALLKQHLNATKLKLANIVISGVVKVIAYAGKTLIVQSTGMAGEVNSNSQHPQEFGFASKPLVGAYALSLFNGGSRDNGRVIIIYDPRYAPVLGDGDSCVYDASGKNKVWLKSNGSVEVLNGENKMVMDDTGIRFTAAPGLFVNFDSPVNFNQVANLNEGFTASPTKGSLTNLKINGNLSATGSVADGTSDLNVIRGTYNIHLHSTPSGESGRPDTLMG